VSIGRDDVIFDLHADFFQTERGDVWNPAEREEKFLRLNAECLSLVFEDDLFVGARVAGASS